MYDDIEPGDRCWRVLTREAHRGQDGALYQTVHRVLVEVDKVTPRRYVVRPVLRGDGAYGPARAVVLDSLEHL